MKIYFWQLRISPHQSSFLSQLSVKNEVNLIVHYKTLSKERFNLGWKVPELRNVNIIYSPTRQVIKRIIHDESDSIHVFSSFYHNKMNFYAFLLAVWYKRKLGILAEPYNWFGFKGKIREYREKIFHKMFGDSISFFLAIGNIGVNLYSKAGYNENKIFEWGYFVSQFNLLENDKVDVNKEFIITFIGRLAEGKGLSTLIKSLQNIQQSFVLYIVGDGPLRSYLKQLVTFYELSDKVYFQGILENRRIQETLDFTDLLVLPSDKKDGWGVVVNEALNSGVPVLCSNNCGASTLLKEYWRGSVFEFSNNMELGTELKKRIDEGKLKIETRLRIQQWALDHISCSAAVGYFESIIEYISSKSLSKPAPPWC